MNSLLLAIIENMLASGQSFGKLKGTKALPAPSRSKMNGSVAVQSRIDREFSSTVTT
jgi:hypothetical protein